MKQIFQATSVRRGGFRLFGGESLHMPCQCGAAAFHASGYPVEMCLKFEKLASDIKNALAAHASKG